MKDKIFKKIIGIIISRNEGGYVNDPQDLGGETKYGISKRSYPNVNIKNLTLEQAENIYYNDFFKKLPFISEPNLMYQLLDHAINAGIGSALKLYKSGMTLDQFKEARRNFYKSLKQFPIYGKSWLRRVDYSIL